MSGVQAASLARWKASTASSRFPRRGVVKKQENRVTPELWFAVYNRDGRRCVAPQLDPNIDPPTCRDRWSNPVSFRKQPASSWGTAPYDLTFAHIKEDPGGHRYHDVAHGVVVCYGHHVFGDMWATSDRGLELIRAHLAKLYPEVWDK